jgi:ribosome-associated protein
MSICSVDQSKNPHTQSQAPEETQAANASNGTAQDAASSAELSVTLPADIEFAIYGALEKKAEDFLVLDLRGVTSLTEFFVVCSGGNQRQNQAISDEVFQLLKAKRERAPMGIEGYDKADWILMDYGDFIVHILSGQARQYYDLERLWRQAKVVAVSDDLTERVAKALKNADAPGTADPGMADSGTAQA